MRTPLAICLATTALVAQSGPLDDRLASADTIAVAFEQSNRAPVVKAGPDVAIVIPSTAHLAGAADDDRLPDSRLVVRWSMRSGPGNATFTAPTQPVTDVAFSVAGSYTLELRAFDGELTSTDTVHVMVQEPPVIFERAIAAANDDAEQGPTKVDRSSKSIEMAIDGTTVQVVGLRFQDVTIPRGATISSACIQFAADRAATGATQLSICGEATDNAAPFQPSSNHISVRPATRAQVAWAPAAWRIPHEAGPNQRTPNLRSILQEITSRPGWKPGNSIVFKITGTGCRTATSYEKRSAGAAKLIVTYHGLLDGVGSDEDQAAKRSQ